MAITALQVIVTAFALFAWSRALLRFKDRRITVGEFAFWTLIWAGVVTVVFVPAIAAGFSTSLGVRRPVDLLVYVSIVLLFYLLFRLYVRIEHTEQEITKLVRETAISRARRK
jgi:hypothetical protein